MVDHTHTVGGVLILPGGRPRSTAPSRPWHLANQRMMWLARSLRHQFGDRITVRRVQYRLRGWNSPSHDALRDAETALSALRQEMSAKSLVLIGHSMGARVAVHLAAHVGGVVALAPWWPHNDADHVPAGCRLLTMHGSADTWTDPRSSRVQTHRARERGVDARWVGVPDAVHYLLRHVRLWHRETSVFIADQLSQPRASRTPFERDH